jgi:hypothetical protein
VGLRPASSPGPAVGLRAAVQTNAERKDTMGRSLIRRYHVLLDLSTLDDTSRHQMVAGILGAAPTSALVAANPAMAASVTALGKKDAALTQSNANVVADKQKLRTDLAAEAIARSDVDGELRSFATLTENAAKSPADVQTVALRYRPPTPKAKLPPVAPAMVDTIIPKKGHGKAIASVHETGTTRLHYIAEWSPDPYGPTTWAPLGTGQGKTRTVTGASGTRVWVRFATVRGSLQSDWGTPVLITIP